MAISEACGLWIEQRVQEELDVKSKTGASLRSIGRKVAAEVEKYFETKVSPNTIYQKTRRQNTGTNVPLKKRTKRKVTQKVAWRKAERDLLKITNYMMKNCEVEADINTDIISQFYHHVDILQTFVDELEKE